MAKPIKCDGCGILEDPFLMDAKPPPGQNPDTADFTVMHCIRCYGETPGPNGAVLLWEPLSGVHAFDRSICPELKPYYVRWMKENCL